ncbi:type II toxin-antitoxin system VapC family toxin [Microbacterium sp.]|uniref:type II toxin-antitoxin system VapC family toxin n=1 Tax=Microbacterium sp. TaxID=51671 RepID=UPI0039E71017
MSEGILDTSVVIALEQLDPRTLPDYSSISAVTLAELALGPLVAGDDRERMRRQLRLQEVELSFDALPVDARVARTFALVAASLRARGKKPAARSFDALIAATALAHRVPLFTLNPRDFDGIDDLDVRVPARSATKAR